MNRNVFISYSRRNFDAVMEIKNQIDRTCGTECWIDLKGIESGSEMFLRDIVGGIDACKVFLFMLSRESMESEYALLELNYAKEQGKRVVLVNIDDCRMNGVFLFKYSLTDTIAWNNPPQREKLLRDVKRWVGGTVTGPKDELLLPVKRGGKWGYANIKGDIVIPCQWEFANTFCEGLAKVKDSNEKYGFIDKSGRIVSPCQWENAFDFSEGLAAVQDRNDNYGFIDKSGHTVIPCQWEFASSFSEGLALVLDNFERYGFIDKSGP